MDVCAQPDVIGQIPTHMVWILINHDLIAVPKPITAEAVVIGCHAEVEAIEPEARRAASHKPPDMRRAKPACEAPVLPRMGEVVVRIIGAGIVADPLTVRVDVGSVGMPGRIAI